MVVCHLFPKQCFFANTFQKMWYLAILATKNKLNSKISWLFNFEPNIHLVCVWEARFAFPKCTFCISVAFFFLFFFNFLSWNVWFFSWTVHNVHCSRTPKFYFSATFSLKNWSHGTIHTFKNYFVTVFSVFSYIQTDP